MGGFEISDDRPPDEFCGKLLQEKAGSGRGGCHRESAQIFEIYVGLTERFVSVGHLAHLSLQQHLRFGIFYDQWSGCWCSYARFSLWNSNGTHPSLREKGVECDRFCCIVVTAVLNVFLFRVFSFPRFAFLPRQRFLGF